MNAVGISNLVLWGVQGFLALLFLFAGIPKLLGSGLERWTGFAELPRVEVVFIGLTEVLGAAALVLPMAVTLFRLTSPVQYVTSAAFIAWAFGIDLGPAQLVAGALLAVVISLGSVGLPGQVTFIATNLPVAQAMGVPVSPLGLMLAVDTIPDAFATLGNVTADLTATAIVVRQSRDDTA